MAQSMKYDDALGQIAQYFDKSGDDAYRAFIEERETGKWPPQKCYALLSENGYRWDGKSQRWLKKHGGKRPGAGRPPLNPENKVSITLTLTPSTIAALKKLGAGNVSEGAEKAVARLNETPS